MHCATFKSDLSPFQNLLLKDRQYKVDILLIKLRACLLRHRELLIMLKKAILGKKLCRETDSLQDINQNVLKLG